jgi:hypothetical protein
LRRWLRRHGSGVTPNVDAAKHPLLPSVFTSIEERLAYYERHKLESERDWLNYNDVVNGRETPDERRARQRGVALRLRLS